MRWATAALTARWRAKRASPSNSVETTRTASFEPSQPESEKSTTETSVAAGNAARSAASAAAAIFPHVRLCENARGENNHSDCRYTLGLRSKHEPIHTLQTREGAIERRAYRYQCKRRRSSIALIIRIVRVRFCGVLSVWALVDDS